MEQNFTTIKAPTSAANVGPGYPPNSSWNDVNNILTDDENYAWIGFFEGGQDGDDLVASDFDFNLPPDAVIDGIELDITGSQIGCYGAIGIGITGTSTKDLGTLNTGYGGATDLWGASSISRSDLADLEVTISTADVSGGDGYASVLYLEITVFWHLEMDAAPADVPTRIAYKVYSREGRYLGELPNVVSDLAFPQDINSAGATIEIECATKAENTITTDPLLTDSDEEILTDNDEPILATERHDLVALGSSANDAIFKNSNRIKAWMYNYWHPNGKLMFSGQVNRVNFKSGANESNTKLLVLSDGLDLSNYIARGYPFAYTTDQSQTQNNASTQVINYSKGGWRFYGQTFRTGAGVSNIGAIDVKLKGTATVTVSLYDAPNGNLLGSVSRSISNGSGGVEQFEFPQLIPVSASTSYFITVTVAAGQSIRWYRQTGNAYANGDRYESWYGGGSGGGLYYEMTANGYQLADFYFVTKSGTPTTTTTYSTQDPVTGMMSKILLDYNARGGLVKERDFDATGLSLTYTFNMAFIFDALKNVLEMSPSGFYSFIDVGTAEIDILNQSLNGDFTLVKGKSIAEIDLILSIEEVKNYLLLTGGETSPGVNLYRKYEDGESSSLYGLRTEPKTDNRITLTATADAVGNSFIDESSDETQETKVTILNTDVDITLFTPGKTIAFRNYGGFVNEMVLQIVRREPNFSKGISTLTLGVLPIRMTAEIQRINRELLNEQTANNPTAPS